MKIKKALKKQRKYLGLIVDDEILGWSIHYNVMTNSFEMKHESVMHNGSVKIRVINGGLKVVDVYFHTTEQVIDAEKTLSTYLNTDSDAKINE